MKIHLNEHYINAEFESQKSMQEFTKSHFNNINEEISDKEKEKIEDMENLYDLLSSEKQHVVNNLIFDLLTGPKKGNVALYLQKFLKYNNIKYSTLSSYICGYVNMSCAFKNDLLHESNILLKYSKNEADISDKLTYNDIKSTIYKLCNTSNVRGDSVILILVLIADYFCVSPDVLVFGEGKCYSLDKNKLKNILDKKNEKISLEEFWKIDMRNDDVKKSENYKNYVSHSVRIIANIFIAIQ